MVFPVVMYRCEKWIIKKAEHKRIDAFELQCWRRLLRVPWTTRRSNQSIVKEINPEYSLAGLMLKLKLQYLATWCEADSLGKNLLLESQKFLTVWVIKNCGKFLKRWEYQTTSPTSWEICMQVKKQQLEPDVEQQTGSKLRKDNVKLVTLLI